MSSTEYNKKKPSIAKPAAKFDNLSTALKKNLQRRKNSSSISKLLVSNPKKNSKEYLDENDIFE